MANYQKKTKKKQTMKYKCFLFWWMWGLKQTKHAGSFQLGFNGKSQKHWNLNQQNFLTVEVISRQHFYLKGLRKERLQRQGWKSHLTRPLQPRQESNCDCECLSAAAVSQHPTAALFTKLGLTSISFLCPCFFSFLLLLLLFYGFVVRLWEN